MGRFWEIHGFAARFFGILAIWAPCFYNVMQKIANTVKGNLKMTKMARHILWRDVANPCGKVPPGGLVILSGDAPVWEYCNCFHRCIMEGASVIAVGHGIDVFGEHATDCVVAYSTASDYTIGKPVSQGLGKITAADGMNHGGLVAVTRPSST